jgi:hypothetical protein
MLENSNYELNINLRAELAARYEFEKITECIKTMTILNGKGMFL